MIARHQIELMYFQLDFHSRHFKPEPLSARRFYHSSLKTRAGLRLEDELTLLLASCSRICEALVGKDKRVASFTAAVPITTMKSLKTGSTSEA